MATERGDAKGVGITSAAISMTESMGVADDLGSHIPTGRKRSTSPIRWE
jgi:hypothetical protein